MGQRPKVFVSYSYPTSSWTTSFLIGLREQGLDPYPDTGQMKDPHRIATQIRTELEQSHYVVLLVDQASTSSPWIAFELGAATSLGKKIVAVVDPKLRPVPGNLKHLAQLPKAGPKATAERVASALGKSAP